MSIFSFSVDLKKTKRVLFFFWVLEWMKIGSSSRISALHPTPRVLSESFLKSFKIISLSTLFYLRDVKTLFIKIKTFFCTVFFSKILQNLSILKLKAFEDSVMIYVSWWFTFGSRISWQVSRDFNFYGRFYHDPFARIDFSDLPQNS